MPLLIIEKMKLCKRFNNLNIHFLDVFFRFIEAKADRVTVIFSTIFKDPEDVILGKLFLQVNFQLNF